jgi:hypothetical protein
MSELVAPMSNRFSMHLSALQSLSMVAGCRQSMHHLLTPTQSLSQAVEIDSA